MKFIFIENSDMRGKNYLKVNNCIDNKDFKTCIVIQISGASFSIIIHNYKMMYPNSDMNVIA